MKTIVAIAVGVFVPAGLILLAVNAWLTRRAAERDAVFLADHIVPPVQIFPLQSPADVQATQAEASRRRAAADYHRRKGQQTASGEPIEDRIRIVGGAKR